MISECLDCGNTRIEANGLCASCGARRRKEARQAAQDALKKPRGLKRPSKPIAKRSIKRNEERTQYSLKRTKFLWNHPTCEVCGSGAATDIHHKAGTENDLLLEQQYWLAVCRPCHILITEDSAWAIKEGYSLPRTVSRLTT